MDPTEILSKNSTKLWFFSQKKWRYMKSKISPKFHPLQFLFFFFTTFGIFFLYFTYPNLSKKYGIFFTILLKELEILSTISRNF